MTIEQLCNLFNLVGILVPTVFSIGTAMFHREPYFRSWTAGYLLSLVSLMLEGVLGPMGHPQVPTFVEMVTYALSGWLCLRMGDELRRKPGNATLRWSIFGLVLGAYVVACLAGKPFETAVTPTLLYYVATQVILGARIIRNPEGRAWINIALGSLVIVTGLWVLSYPAMLAMGAVAVGFAISGMLHLTLGMAMVLFLLSDVASRLHAHNEELKMLERLQADFIGNMNHEFRTPLNAIKTGAFLLGNTPEAERLSERQRETLDILAMNADRVIELVNDVLDISKIESGTLIYEREVTDLNELLGRVTVSLAQLFEVKGIELKVDLPAEPVVAAADARRIEQVVTNLLSNALKFTAKGGVVHTRLAVEAEHARIEVADTGVGIAPTDVERVFTKFFQVDGTTTRRAGGTGLGLTICKAIVEDGHHGRIWAEPRPVGTTFVATIPL